MIISGVSEKQVIPMRIIEVGMDSGLKIGLGQRTARLNVYIANRPPLATINRWSTVGHSAPKKSHTSLQKQVITGVKYLMFMQNWFLVYQAADLALKKVCTVAGRRIETRPC